VFGLLLGTNNEMFSLERVNSKSISQECNYSLTLINKTYLVSITKNREIPRLVHINLPKKQI